MKACAILTVLLLLAGCAATPPQREIERLFEDSGFGERPPVPGAEEVFAISEPMRAYVRTSILPGGRVRGPRVALYEALNAGLKLDYDTATTRTAREAFEARAGNCLSLVILAGALARELDIPVVYQAVHGYDTWSRTDGIAFLSGHVNLELGTYAPQQSGVVMFDRPVIIDFVEDAGAVQRRARPITEQTVVAMYLNNRAAESLGEGDVTRAYWLARSSIETAPTFMSAYNTLAVIYMRHGDLRAARRVLDYALEREPANPQMLSNLANVYAREGRYADAKRILRELADASRYPPFHFLDLGNEALAAGDTERAMQLFRKELKRIPYDHELHFAIALASLRLGDIEQAREHITLAMENSTRRDQRDIYAAKLSRLGAGVH